MIITGIDIETTGLEVEKSHRIIEFCAILYDFETRQERIRFTQRINPHRTIDRKAFEVHGISAEDLASAPSWEAVAPKIAMIFEKTDIGVGHNGDWFDFPFIAEELVRVGAPLHDITLFDTMLKGLWATPTGKRPSLKELCFACDVEYDVEKAHAADYDVERMMACLWKGLDWGFYKL